MPESDPSSPSSPPSRVLIVRLSAIGDIVFATPLIHAMRRAWPDAWLAWLVQTEYRGLLDGHPDLNAVIACPLTEWRRLWRGFRFGALRAEIRALRSELRAHHFDLALDLQGLFKSGALAWLSGAPTRIGLGSREGSPWLMTRVIQRGGHAERIGSEYLHLAEILELPTDDFAMRVQYTEQDRSAVERFIATELGAWRLQHGDVEPDEPDAAEAPGAAETPEVPETPDNPDSPETPKTPDAAPTPVATRRGYAVLCPFTTRPQKHWFEDAWVELAGRLWRELRLVPVLLGARADRAAAARIVAACDPAPLDLTGRTLLTTAAAVIDRADLVVGVDTGLSHMGIACHRPTLLLFGATRPYLDPARDNARVLYQALPCSPCRRRPTCEGRFDCMRRITPDAVLEAARALLAVPEAEAEAEAHPDSDADAQADGEPAT